MLSEIKWYNSILPIAARNGHLELVVMLFVRIFTRLYDDTAMRECDHSREEHPQNERNKVVEMLLTRFGANVNANNGQCLQGAALNGILKKLKCGTPPTSQIYRWFYYTLLAQLTLERVPSHNGA